MSSSPKEKEKRDVHDEFISSQLAYGPPIPSMHQSIKGQRLERNRIKSQEKKANMSPEKLEREKAARAVAAEEKRKVKEEQRRAKEEEKRKAKEEAKRLLPKVEKTEEQKERKRAANKQRWANLTDEDKEEINRKKREWMAGKKLKR